MSDHATAPVAASATIQVQGITLRVAEVLQVETKLAESYVRNTFFLFTGLACPILAMIIFTCLRGQQMWAAGLACAAAPFIGMLISLVWKKPWGVLVETPTRYRTVFMSASKDAADQITNQIRAALPQH